MDIDDAVARLLPDHELGRQLGRGQFGVVWEARHRHLGRRVAVKQLVGAGDGDENARRFRREARILAGLDHPHVVTVFDYREDGDLRLIVMEHLGGGTLSERLRELDPPARLAATIAAATGLHHAHMSGVLHRDVKPENLMFDRRQVLKVTDFGVARADVAALGSATVTDVELSRIGQLLGTPAYLSPEQAAAAMSGTAAELAPAADLYGLAAVTFELLTGELTHDAEGGLIGLCHRRINEPAPPVRTLAPAVPPAVAEVVDRALARSPADRHESLEAFAVDLARAGTESFGRGWVERSPVELRDTGAVQRALDEPTSSGWGAGRRRDRLADTTRPTGSDTPSPAAPPPPPPGHPLPGRGPAPAGPTHPSPPPGAPPPTSGRPTPDPVPQPVAPAPAVATAHSPRTSTAPGRTRRRVLSLLAVAGVVAIVGAAIVLLRPGDDPGGIGAEMTVAWSAATGADVFSSPVVDGDRVVVGSDDGTVTVVAAADGSPVWSRQVTGGQPVRASVAVVGDAYLVAGFDGHLHSLARADGAERWSQDLGFEVVATPAVGGDTVVVGADALHGRALADGAPLWEYRSPAADECPDGLGTVFVGSPVVIGDSVLAVSAEGTVHAVALATGTPIWTSEAPGCDLVARPHVAADGVTVGDGDGVLWTLSLADGSVVHRVELGEPVRAAVAADDGGGAVGTVDGVVGLDPDRRVRWRTDLPGAVDSSPVLVDGLVVVGSNDGRVYALDAPTGQVVSSVRTGGEVLSSPAVVDDTTVVVGSSDDALRALTDLRG